MMKFCSYNLPKEHPKNYKTYDTPLELFHQQLEFFIIPGNKDLSFYFWNFFYNFWNFIESLNVILINMIPILVMPAKFDIPGFLEIKEFWNERYNDIIFIYDATNKILSCESNYVLDAVIWPKFVNSSISMREVIITSII